MSGSKKRLGVTERKEGKVSDTPTPRTDNFVLEHDFRPSPSDCLNFCVKLERELTEAQDRIDDLTATGIHSCGNDCKRPNCVLRRELEKARLERDNALSDWRQADTDSIRAIGERNEARESEASEARWAAQYKQQRDALAKVARDIRAGYGGQVVDADCPCEDCELLGKLDSALATLEGRAE
jgi:hypothetical protein